MIPQQTPVKNHYGNNSAMNFDFDFYIENEEQLLVVHTGLDGVESVLEYGVDYRLNANSIGYQEGGSIIFPLDGSKYDVLAWNTSTDEKELLSISLNLPIEQPAEYNTSGDLNKKNLEYSFDYLTRLLQILSRKIERAVKISEGADLDTDKLVYNINFAVENFSSIDSVASNIDSITKVDENKQNITTCSNNISSIISAGEEARIATEQANIAEQKVTEFSQLSNNVISEVNGLKSEALDNIEEIKEESINLIQDEQTKSINSIQAKQEYSLELLSAQKDNICSEMNSLGVVHTNNAKVQADIATTQAQLAKKYAQSVDIDEHRLIISNMYLTGEVSVDDKGFNQLKELKRSTFDLSKFEVVGSPTITADGIASGFSGSNRIRTKDLLNFHNKTFSIKVKFKQEDWSAQCRFFTASGIALSVAQDASSWTLGRFVIFITTDSGSIASYALSDRCITKNQYNYVKFIYDGSKYTVQHSLDDKIYTTVYTLASTESPVNTDRLIDIGAAISDVAYISYIGQIDLSQFSITVDGVEVFNGNKTGIDTINNIEIPYTISKTGSKIVDSVYRDRVQDMYEQFGQANYYTLLDGEKYNVKAVNNPILSNGILKVEQWDNSQNLGYTYVDITFGSTFEIGFKFKPYSAGTVNYGQIVNCNGVFSIAMDKGNRRFSLFASSNGTNWDIVSYGVSTNNIINLDTWNYGKVISDGNTFKMFISNNGTDYNEVFSVDGNLVGNITKRCYFLLTRSDKNYQIMGGEFDLEYFYVISNGKEVFRGYEKDNFTLPKGEMYGMLDTKLDTHTSNLSIQGKELISGLSMPSNRYIDLTLGASGTRYTAPANGWIWLRRISTATNQQIGFDVEYGVRSSMFIVPNNAEGNVYVPVKKNDIFTVFYGSTKDSYFRFYYTEGSKGE